jgi:predicted dehydrogenase
MEPLDEVRWGILGCGDVCEKKSGPAFAKCEGSKLVAVMRRDGDKARDYATRHNVSTWYDDARALIDDANVNAVYIATPPGAHLELAKLVAQAEKPCYVEKPMARSFVECRAMNEIFESRNVPLYVAFYRRGLARFRRAKELVESGKLGEISGVSYRQTQKVAAPERIGWRVDAEVSGAGLFLDLASHTLDALDFIFGPLQNASGNAANIGGAYAAEDSVSLRFDLPNGAAGVGIWNYAGSVYEDNLVIDGTRGRLSMSIFGFEPLKLHTESGVQELADEQPEHVQQVLIQSIVDELRGRGQAISTGRSAERTSKVMDVALEEFYGGRADDFWTRPQSWKSAR